MVPPHILENSESAFFLGHPVCVFVHSFGCHRAENDQIHREMVVDCLLLITSKAKPYSRPDKTRKEERMVQLLHS